MKNSAQINTKIYSLAKMMSYCYNYVM